MFEVKNNKKSARLGILKTRKGEIRTPCFMPIATKGAIKTISAEEIRLLGPDIILGNTYHLMLRPGSEEIKKLGGLHSFMDWDKPILTDSGGFQVFSLAHIRRLKIDGVTFNSHIDGREYFLSPEKSIEIQMNIGSDIMMVLDECVKLPAEREYLEKSVEVTTTWARRCKSFFRKQFDGMNSVNQVNQVNQLNQPNKPLLFGIVQGGLEQDLREKSASDLIKIGFDGYAVGGLSVGETEQQMCSVLDYLCEKLPADKPRYLMGVGYPHQIVEAVRRGIDMFDCVIPTREARHGRLFYWNPEFFSGGKNLLELLENSREFYKTINIRNEEFKFDLTPINSDSKFPELRNYSRAYLRHIFSVEDPLAQRLASLNNLEFYLSLMEKIRGTLE